MYLATADGASSDVAVTTLTPCSLLEELMSSRSRLGLTLPSRRVPFPSRLALVALAAVASVGTIVGCGSSSKPAITKTAFLKKGNAICAQGNRVTNAAGAKLGQNPTRAQVIAVVKTKFVPSIQGSINSIRALGAPSGDQAKVTSMLNLAQADLNKLKSNPLLIAGNSSPFADFAKVAHPYGLTACAESG
jgi:hypothetical protein